MEASDQKAPTDKPTEPVEVPPAPPTSTAAEPLEIHSESKSHKKLWLVIGLITVLLLASATAWWLMKDAPMQQAASTTQTNASDTPKTAEKTVASNAVGDLKLVTTKNYGDKYADGILPVGDNQYVTTTGEKGKVYMCNANFVPASQAGAQTRGPWFVGTTQWDVTKKYAVRGSVKWEPSMSNTVSGVTRTVTTNNLPNHMTGTFPVAFSDPAYSYDRNPNTIKSQSLTYSLSSAPTYGDPQCMGGEVGVLLTGVALFNAFDAGGRDAGAWEIQDSCEGHPQSSGLYHYHTLSSCITDVGVGTVIGFALDGFPITGPKIGEKNYLTTSDLDECHGITSEITLDSKKVVSYHYVMTQDFPYSASCFRSKATQAPGQHSGGPPAKP